MQLTMVQLVLYISHAIMTFILLLFQLADITSG